MRKTFGLACLFFMALNVKAQPAIVRQDSVIAKMVSAVSAQNIENNIRKLVSFGTRHTLSDTLSKVRGIGAARTWIKAEMERYSKESGGRLKVEYDTFIQPADGKRVPAPVQMKNVLAVLPGSDPGDNRIYIVSGHYDSRATDVMNSSVDAPGANDDASGTAATMELARVMSKEKFNCTLMFVAVVGEEQGLYGSTHLARRAKENGWNVAGMISNDIVGNTYGIETDLKDNRSLRVFSEGVPAAETPEQARLRSNTGSENDSPARQFARYFKEIAERYVDQLDVRMIYRRDRYLRGGDHTPFSEAGFPAIRVTEMNENFYRQHQNVRRENGIDYGDTPDFVDFAYTRKVACANLATVASLALAPREPQNVAVVTSQLTNKTVLKWDAPSGEVPAGYWVLIRDTGSPVWEKKFWVNGNTATLNYSKDNYFFGVQAADAGGHESIPVIPKPQR